MRNWNFFWFALSALASTNGCFILSTLVFNSGWLRMVTAAALTVGFRRIFEVKLLFEPIFLDFGSLYLLQVISASWGVNWAIMVVQAMNVVPLVAAYLFLRPYPRFSEETFVKVVMVSGQWVALGYSLFGPLKYGDCYGMTPFAAGMMSHTDFILFHLQLPRSERHRRPSMKSQIAGIQSVVPRAQKGQQVPLPLLMLQQHQQQQHHHHQGI